MKREHIGSDFDGFLQEDGLLAECEAGALKRVVTWQIEQEMKRRRISRATLASRMKTNRGTLDRLFSEKDSSVTLQLLEQAALALGRKLKVDRRICGQGCHKIGGCLPGEINNRRQNGSEYRPSPRLTS